LLSLPLALPALYDSAKQNSPPKKIITLRYPRVSYNDSYGLNAKSIYKMCWNIIKPDVLAALAAVQSGNFRNLQLLNTALLTLLPKKEDAVLVKDFRPISLIHSFAKLVTKLVANRLAIKLNEIVAANQQSAFIKGRCISSCKLVPHHTCVIVASLHTRIGSQIHTHAPKPLAH